MAQVFETQEQVVEHGTPAQVQPFLEDVLRRSAGHVKLKRTRSGSLRCRYKPTLLAPAVSLFVTAEPVSRAGEQVLVLRWWAQIASLPGGRALEGDLLDGSGARFAVSGRAGERNHEVLGEFERQVFRPAVEALRASLEAQV